MLVVGTGAEPGQRSELAAPQEAIERLDVAPEAAVVAHHDLAVRRFRCLQYRLYSA